MSAQRLQYAKRSKSSSPSSGPVDIGGGAASPTPPGNGNWNNRNNNRDGQENWQKVKEKYLESKLRQQGTDPHAIKYEYLGKGASVQRYDIYVDKISGRLAIFEKSTGRLVGKTYYFIK